MRACDFVYTHSSLFSLPLMFSALQLHAQVILLKNLDIDEQLVNGARGVVAGFETGDDGFST